MQQLQDLGLPLVIALLAEVHVQVPPRLIEQ